MPETSVLKVAATPSGCSIRIEGRGTMRESHSAAQFAARALAAPAATVVVDLFSCEYLDSTFLGCLVEMHRRGGKSVPPRFAVSAPPEKVRKLLTPTRLDMVIKTTAEPPQVVGEYVTLPAGVAGSPELMRHVMECHRLLAAVGGPQQQAFAAIADGIERELNQVGATAGKPAR